MMKNIGISMQTVWDLDLFIEETEILLSVCKRLRDKRLHNKRCCQNCESMRSLDERRLCTNERVVALMENPVEFEIEGDLRIFVCPFFAFRPDPEEGRDNGSD